MIPARGWDPPAELCRNQSSCRNHRRFVGIRQLRFRTRKGGAEMSEANETPTASREPDEWWPDTVKDIFRGGVAALGGDDAPLLRGPAHIVWTDSNFDDESIRWCIEEAA